MPLAAAASPRKMLPPPTTIAISTPPSLASAICAAISRVTSGSIPYCRDPISASPESFSSTRRYAGAPMVRSSTSGGLFVNAVGGGLADRHPDEARDPDVLAEQRDLLGDQVAHLLVGVAVLQLHQADRLEPLAQLALDDLRDPVGGPSLTLDVLGEGSALLVEHLGGHVLAADEERRVAGDLHRQVAAELLEIVG